MIMPKKNSILIIDYGLGNLSSVVRGITAASGNPLVSQSFRDLTNAQKVILPGVGAFPAGMEGLKKRKLVKPILEYVKSGRELLGLCLGMQLLFNSSEEFGNHHGLGLINGTVKLIKPANRNIFKIPHIGWNSLIKSKGKNWSGTILGDVADGDMVYFIHSYAPQINKNTFAQTEYGGIVFCSVFAKDNVTGTQFHLEKSGEIGQKILKRFVEK